MYIPINFSNIGLWLTMSSIILLITLELTSNYYGSTNIEIDRKKLQNVAIAVFVLFLFSIISTALNVIMRA